MNVKKNKKSADYKGKTSTSKNYKNDRSFSNKHLNKFGSFKANSKSEFKPNFSKNKSSCKSISSIHTNSKYQTRNEKSTALSSFQNLQNLSNYHTLKTQNKKGKRDLFSQSLKKHNGKANAEHHSNSKLSSKCRTKYKFNNYIKGNHSKMRRKKSLLDQLKPQTDTANGPLGTLNFNVFQNTEQPSNFKERIQLINLNRRKRTLSRDSFWNMPKSSNKENRPSEASDFKKVSGSKSSKFKKQGKNKTNCKGIGDNIFHSKFEIEGMKTIGSILEGKKGVQTNFAELHSHLNKLKNVTLTR